MSGEPKARAANRKVFRSGSVKDTLTLAASRQIPPEGSAAPASRVSGQVIAGAEDYGGTPAKPVREWLREIHAVKQLARRRKQEKND